MTETEKDAYIIALEADLANQMLMNSQLRAYILQQTIDKKRRKSLKVKVL